MFLIIGVKLLTETDLYDQAIDYIKKAKELGHGKADNILKNIELDPSLRDKAKLLQTPKQKKDNITNSKGFKLV